MLRALRKAGVLLSIAGAVVPFVCPGAVRPVTNGEEQIARFLEQFRSPSDVERSRAFYDLLNLGATKGLQGRIWLMPSVVKTIFDKYPGRADQIRIALIELLEKEDSTVEAANRRFLRSGGGERLSEDYVNYWGDLIAAVASLKDPRAVQALVGAISTGGMAENSLARFGRAALDPVVAKLDDDEITRTSAAVVLSKMLDPENAKQVGDPASQAKIKNALFRAAKDENAFVRKAAVLGLGKLHGADVTALLEKLAREDPYEASMYGGPKGIYPVREAAKKALGPQR